MPNGEKRNHEGCTCDEHKGDFHTCPFDEDVNGNPDSECDCCPECEYECGQSI